MVLRVCLFSSDRIIDLEEEEEARYRWSARIHRMQERRERGTSSHDDRQHGKPVTGVGRGSCGIYAHALSPVPLQTLPSFNIYSPSQLPTPLLPFPAPSAKPPAPPCSIMPVYPFPNYLSFFPLETFTDNQPPPSALARPAASTGSSPS